MNSREYYCPKCGGWLEILGPDELGCDTCDYTVTLNSKLDLSRSINKKQKKEEKIYVI